MLLTLPFEWVYTSTIDVAKWEIEHGSWALYSALYEKIDVAYSEMLQRYLVRLTDHGDFLATKTCNIEIS